MRATGSCGAIPDPKVVIRWASFYHLVDAGEKRGGRGEAERVSALEADLQFNFGALLDGERLPEIRPLPDRSTRGNRRCHSRQ